MISMIDGKYGRCDYCYKKIRVEFDVCSICIHNLRELQKDPRLQQITLDEHTMKNVVTFELPKDSST